MCGIVGYTGARSAVDPLIEGLRRLEYRGYDSAGIALGTPTSLFIEKRAGKLANNSAISGAVKAAETTLGSSGRVLLRASGTENLVRVMVEASSDNLASEVATALAEVVRKELSL